MQKIKDGLSIIGAIVGFILFLMIAAFLLTNVYEAEGIPVITLIGLCSAIGTLLLDLTIERWKEENEEEDK